MRTLGVLLFLATFIASSAATAQSALTRNPESARLVFDDLPRFWAAWDLAKDAESDAARAEIFQARYLSPGTTGLVSFTRERIGNARNLVATIAARPHYYSAMRGQDEIARAAAPEIRAAFRTLAEMYPDAVFPDVYFLIGRMNSGGTISDAGLLIGIEMYGRRDDTLMTELGDWHRAVLKPMTQLSHIVAHELVHYQQRYPSGSDSLLSRSISEGVADFVGELVSGQHINPHVHAWADLREAVLWQEFRQVMHASDLKGWLYDTNPGDGRPADLGYYVGYRIAKAHYERTPDKRAALRTMLVIDDFDAFVAGSGYAPRGEKGDRGEREKGDGGN